MRWSPVRWFPIPTSWPGLTGRGGSGRTRRAPAHDLKGAAIAALLEEADAAELSLHRPGNPGLSTESPDFAELLEQLGTGLRGPADAPADAQAATAAAAPAERQRRRRSAPASRPGARVRAGAAERYR